MKCNQSRLAATLPTKKLYLKILNWSFFIEERIFDIFSCLLNELSNNYMEIKRFKSSIEENHENSQNSFKKLNIVLVLNFILAKF